MPSMLKRLVFVASFLLFTAAWTKASEGFDDIVTLAKAGASEDVLLAFIEKSPVSYHLTDDEATLLDDLGISQKVIDALRAHGGNGGQAPAPAPVAEAPNDPDADIQTVAVASASDDQNISYFYSSLAPYGSWISVDGNWCWRPTAAMTEVRWRPYCHRGHWVYTDWGWTWYSDYSWGWAPFHYGRWEMHAGYGWIWHPDNVWGPAWVHWRTNESDYGWAPLPPRAQFEAGIGFSFDGKHVGLDFDFGLASRDYCFVPGEHFCDANLLEFRIHHRDVLAFYDRTVAIKAG